MQTFELGGVFLSFIHNPSLKGKRYKVTVSGWTQEIKKRFERFSDAEEFFRKMRREIEIKVSVQKQIEAERNIEDRNDLTTESVASFIQRGGVIQKQSRSRLRLVESRTGSFQDRRLKAA